MQVEGRVGSIDAAYGSVNPLRTDEHGGLVVTGGGSSLAEAVIQGRAFSASSGTKVATTAGVTTTWTGLGVWNPSASGKNVIIHEFGFGQMLAADTIGVIGLQTATIAAPAADLTVYNCLDGASASASVCYAINADTLVLPVLKRALSSYDDAAATGENPLPNIYNINGSLVLPPGRAVCTYTTLATTACYVFHFVWEEKDV